MRSKMRTRKPNRHKTKLGLPDLEHVKSAVIVSLRSPESQRSYRHSIEDFVSWYCSEPRLSFNKTVVNLYNRVLAPACDRIKEHPSRGIRSGTRTQRCSPNLESR
jgi:hypothetical protein